MSSAESLAGSVMGLVSAGITLQIQSIGGQRRKAEEPQLACVLNPAVRHKRQLRGSAEQYGNQAVTCCF